MRTAAFFLFVSMGLSPGARESLAQTPPPSPFSATRITHVGVVVRDITASAKTYADVLGVPLPVVSTLDGIKFRPDYRGDTSRAARPKVAVIRLANIDIELLQPQGGVSPWRSHLERRGEGIHHVGFAVTNVAEAVQYLEARGARVMLGGVAGSAVNYLDTDEQFGAIVEPDDTTVFAARSVPAYSPESFANNSAIHVSTVVPSAQAAGEAVSRLFGLPMPPPTGGGSGGGPGIPYPPSYKGDRKARVKHVTYALREGIELELSEAVGGSSPWRDHLDTFGPSTHHIAFLVKDLAKSIAFLESKGGQLTLGGDGRVYFAYVDLKPRPLGFTFELNGPR